MRIIKFLSWKFKSSIMRILKLSRGLLELIFERTPHWQLLLSFIHVFIYLFICWHPREPGLGQGSGDTAVCMTQSPLSGPPHILVGESAAAPATLAIDEKPSSSPELAEQAPPLGPGRPS